ncbi:hypothetical protein [Mesorhizobium sp. M0011]|uniref:hypothetical protein n=1 Tax=Mesorhizobium sp. M0011 TaxID=2956839 RepID=UPI00333AE39A
MKNEASAPDELVGIVTIRVTSRNAAAIIAHAQRYVAEFGPDDEDHKPVVIADNDYKSALLYLFDTPDDVDVGTVTSAEIIQAPEAR